MDRFLIDECLSGELVAAAKARGYAAAYVPHLGKAGWQDWNPASGAPHHEGPGFRREKALIPSGRPKMASRRMNPAHAPAVGQPLLEMTRLCTLPRSSVGVNGTAEMSAVEGVAPEADAGRKMPPGVLFEGPVVDAKFLDSYIAFGLMVGGSVAALVWAFTIGIGWIEIWVFVGMFVLSTIGIGFMHRYFVHRSFRCGPVMRAILAAIATMAVQGSVLKWVSNHRRHHHYSDRPGDVHSPYYDGDGNRIASFARGMMHAQGGWVWDQATTDATYYARDILADPISMFFTRTR